MRAVAWHGRRDVRVDTVPDPGIEAPTDAIVEVTSTAICGSDLHLYELMGMWMEPGDILGHEAMGIVREVGDEVSHIQPGDRVVVPFNISCGRCFMCDRDLFAQCETTQVREHGKGAALFGYTKLYGHVPGAQAEYLRVPQAHFGPIKVPGDHPDERFLYLSDILPTAWQAVAYAEVPKGGSLAVLGLGPVGQFCTRIARYQGVDTVIGIDRVPERIEMARRHGVQVLDGRDHDDVAGAVRELTGGRGADGVIDAVGMEAHGWPVAGVAQKATGFLPDRLAQPMMARMGVDRLSALHSAFKAVRRGGTVSIVGVYGGQVDPMPMMDLFDKGIQLRMGQAHVRRWTDEILPVLLSDGDVLGTEDLCTHPLPIEQAPHGYEIFQQKRDGAIKVVLKPGQRPGPAGAAGASPGNGGAAGAGGASGPGSEGGPVRSR
jgi:threonine dehydrogenase-like Zn-dependent dehydrogenase